MHNTTLVVDPAGYSYDFLSSVYEFALVTNNLVWSSLIYNRSLTTSKEFLSAMSEKYSLDPGGANVAANRASGVLFNKTQTIAVFYRAYDRNDAQEWTVNLSTETEEELLEIDAFIKELLPAIILKDPNSLPIKFWAMSRNGPGARVRDIIVPSWDNIDINYPPATSETLNQLMSIRTPQDAGKLLLFYGEPGGGKTYAIRALVRAWSPWCNAHYVVDPEVFFGEADYMLNVLLDSNNSDPNFTEGAEGVILGDDRWMLLIIEDAHEFLTTDAQKYKGQSLSRLLNVADGFIGQGINLLIMITTNEKISDIHPAISRDGRCLSNLEFPKFSAVEARHWMKFNGLDSPIDNAMSLAQLYTKRRDLQQIKNQSNKPLPGIYL